MMQSKLDLIVTTPDALRAIVAEEVSRAIEKAQRTAGECVGIDGMAARYNVSKRTVCNWLKQPGKLPPRRAGQRWLLSDVLEWERHIEVQNLSQQAA